MWHVCVAAARTMPLIRYEVHDAAAAVTTYLLLFCVALPRHEPACVR